MTDAAQDVALIAAAVNLVAAAWGAYVWYRVVDATAVTWRLIRIGQAASVLNALIAGGLYIGGMRPDDGLYALYVGLPIAVSFVAEQFRALSAETVLEARGLPDAAAVGELDEAAQRSVVTAILRRELGIMVVAGGVAVFLLLRAYSTV